MTDTNVYVNPLNENPAPAVISVCPTDEIETLREVLREIGALLKTHPEADKGNSKVHYAMHRALGAAGPALANDQESDVNQAIKSMSRFTAEYLLDECVGVGINDDMSDDDLREKVLAAYTAGKITRNEILY